ncbi:MBL fold metallo-hydrolase [Kiritimatiellota bacterium B12222]|nr:MBL fold metallo-hydrolase [Kiritimatiellota bacterium B12222]
MIRLKFLGTGWSHGVPTIGCTCPVCTDTHPRNYRRRSSIQVMDDAYSVVVDVGPDFRDQALSFQIQQLDAVFITHQHADHVMGLDDVRRFSWIQKSPLPVYAEGTVLKRLSELYPYVRQARTGGTAVPLIHFTPWQHPVTVGSMTFTPIEVPHAGMHCVGIRIDGDTGSLGYVPDCSGFSDEALAQLEDLDVMILNALRVEPHPAHLSLEQSLEWLGRINAKRSLLTHMGCPLDYEALNPQLPEGVEMAWDGLQLSV